MKLGFEYMNRKQRNWPKEELVSEKGGKIDWNNFLYT